MQKHRFVQQLKKRSGEPKNTENDELVDKLNDLAVKEGEGGGGGGGGGERVVSGRYNVRSATTTTLASGPSGEHSNGAKSKVMPKGKSDSALISKSKSSSARSSTSSIASTLPRIVKNHKNKVCF